MQDKATTHTVDQSIQSLSAMSSDQVIINWLLHSPGLNSCGFYLWGMLKYKACVINPNTPKKLKMSE